MQKFPLTDALAKRLASPARREILADILTAVHVMLAPELNEIHVLLTNSNSRSNDQAQAALDVLDASTIDSRVLNAARPFTTTFPIPLDLATYLKSQRANPSIKNIESDLNVIMHCLFDGDTAELVLMGESLNRRRAEYRIKGTVDYAKPGYFTDRSDPTIKAEWGFVARLDQPRFDGIRKSAQVHPRRCQINVASQCEVAVLDNRWLCMVGNRRSQELAMLLLEARDNPGQVSLSRLEDHNDSLVVVLPSDSVSGLYSQTNNLLAEVMDATGVVLILVGGGRDRPVHAAIFSVCPRARLRAKYMLMDKVERLPGRSGHYSRGVKDNKILTPGFSSDTFRLLNSEEAFVRKPEHSECLNRISQCVVGFVGDIAFFSGELDERKRGRRYMRWLLESRVGRPEVDSHDPDISVICEAKTGDREERVLELQRESRAFVFIANVGSKGPCYIMAHPQQGYRDRVMVEMRRIARGSEPPAKRRRSH